MSDVKKMSFKKFLIFEKRINEAYKIMVYETYELIFLSMHSNDDWRNIHNILYRYDTSEDVRIKILDEMLNLANKYKVDKERNKKFFDYVNKLRDSVSDNYIYPTLKEFLLKNTNKYVIQNNNL